MVIKVRKPWIPQRARSTEAWADDERYHSTHWRKYRNSFLRDNPLCEECKAAGKIVPATIVGHIKPVRTNPELFWDKSNHKSLCRNCNHRTNKK